MCQTIKLIPFVTLLGLITKYRLVRFSVSDRHNQLLKQFQQTVWCWQLDLVRLATVTKHRLDLILFAMPKNIIYNKRV